MGLVRKETMRKMKEGFTQQNPNVLYDVAILVINLVILAYLGQFLWNKAAVPLVPALSKCNNPMQLLGLVFLLNMMFL